MTIGNLSDSSYSSTHVMAMPAVITKVTDAGYQLSLKYVHDFCVQYPRKLSTIFFNFLFSLITEAATAFILITLPYVVRRKIHSAKCIPSHRGIEALETQPTSAGPAKAY